MKQTTRIMRTYLSILNVVLCVLSHCPSSIHCAPALATTADDFYEDTGGGTGDIMENSNTATLRKSYDRHQINRRSLPDTDRFLTIENIEDPKTSQATLDSHGLEMEPRSSDTSLRRARREGFIDISDVPRMMRHVARSLGDGLPSMIHSMMMHGQHLGHQMMGHLLPHRDTSPPIVHYTKPSKPAPPHSTSSTGSSYKHHQSPDIIYGEWVPIGSSSPSAHKPSTSYGPKPPPPKPNSGYHPPPSNYVPIGPPEKPKPIYGKPKPAYVKPQPVYNKPPPPKPAPPGRYPPPPVPPLQRPPFSYKPVGFPKPPPQPSVPSIVGQHYGSPKPPQEEDSYGTPLGNLVGVVSTPSNNYPAPPPTSNQYVPSVTEGISPFTEPPYQTTFTSGASSLPPIKTPSQPTSGDPLTGVFVESGDDSHKDADAVHAVADWSDDENHIKPIRDSTLYYNDLRVGKFKGHHKDGRTPEHAAKKAKEHHRVEKSAPKFPNFPIPALDFKSSPLFSTSSTRAASKPLSGVFQAHHLPPIRQAGVKKHHKRKTVPSFQRSRSPETLFHRLFF